MLERRNDRRPALFLRRLSFLLKICRVEVQLCDIFLSQSLINFIAVCDIAYMQTIQSKHYICFKAYSVSTETESSFISAVTCGQDGIV